MYLFYKLLPGRPELLLPNSREYQHHLLDRLNTTAAVKTGGNNMIKDNSIWIFAIFCLWGFCSCREQKQAESRLSTGTGNNPGGRNARLAAETSVCEAFKPSDWRWMFAKRAAGLQAAVWPTTQPVRARTDQGFLPVWCQENEAERGKMSNYWSTFCPTKECKKWRWIGRRVHKNVPKVPRTFPLITPQICLVF